MNATLPSAAELQYFVEVANTLNISRAAERLGISQPTLSLAIQRLEGSFGTPLLLRGRSGVHLTQAGRKLVAQARALIDEWERIRADALKDEQQIGGRYTIGCHPSVAIYTLPDFLPALIEEHPQLEVKLVHDLSRKITEDVISFKIDFGIVVNPTQHPDLVIKTLCEDRVSLWKGKGSSNRAVLLCDPELTQTQTLLKQFARAGIHFDRTITSSNLEVITALVANGAGIGVLPERVAGRVKALGLRPYSDDCPSFHDRICLIYRPDMQRSLASRTIARYIEGKLSARKS